MPSVGETLLTSTGGWTNSPSSYAYQWRRDGVNIGGATTSTYLLVSADEGTIITVAVVATNAFGSSAPAVSLGEGPVTEAAPVTTGLQLYAGGALDLYGGGNLDLYADFSGLELYDGGSFDLYAGGNLELYAASLAIPAAALLLNGVPVLLNGQYILV
jgi:hypothetical protein